MKLYSYIVRFDVGFAPNPFHGWCTLGTCKYKMRKSVCLGDWIVGTGSRESGLSGRIVFIMHVQEDLAFDDYWCDPRFQLKRPNFYGSYMQAVGDNIYHRDANGTWIQAESHHSNHDGTPNVINLIDDTKTDRVLLSQDFAYWGRNAIEVPEQFMQNRDGIRLCFDRQGYKSDFPVSFVHNFVEWFRSLGQTGCLGDPVEFPKMLKNRV